ncbi:partial Photosynthetic apparatus regulatory protein RegA, partial [Rhodocyclaceae bacterium]
MLPRKHILVVEDDPDLARVLTRAFRARRLEAVSVRDADEAMAAARRQPPDYAILDLRLGERSGLALIRPLKAINPAARVLVLTGYASIATAVDSIKLGACHYMAKPAYVDEIVSALGIAADGADDGGTTAAEGGKRGFGGLEWKHIMRTLREQDGNISAAARMLGMHRRTLQRRLTAQGKDMVAAVRQRASRRRRTSPGGD